VPKEDRENYFRFLEVNVKSAHVKSRQELIEEGKKSIEKNRMGVTWVAAQGGF